MEKCCKCGQHAPEQPPRYTTVDIPDLFQSFVQHTPRTNPNYETVKLESERWLGDFCSFGPKMNMKINKCDFSYFCAVAAPDAPAVRLRTLCDWGNWVFPFDDMFDNGELRDQPEESQKVMDRLMAPMLDKESGEEIREDRLRIVQVHDSVVRRISKKSSPGVQRRFATTMQSYCNGAVAHVADHSEHRIPQLEEMVMTRQESAGVSPLYHLVEYAHSIRLPDWVFEHPVVQELEILGIDMVSISNDMLSYAKEESEGVPHNMVAACRMNGMSAQEAYNVVGRLMETRFRRWNELEKQVPTWENLFDDHVRRYVEGIKCVVQANISWSFRSQRYLGKNPELVRKTRKMQVMENPPYLRLCQGCEETQPLLGKANPREAVAT